MNYTKGKWEAVGPCVRDEEHIEICSCSMYQKSPNSNARLIAAAPEMYEALKALIKAEDGGFECLGYGRSQDARQVIAKVEGGK